jgi:hypothetical protein
MRKKILALMGLVIVVVAHLTLTPVVAAYQGAMWQATYWNNRNLSGTPVLQRPEPDIDYDWSSAPPALEVNGDNFSVRWTRTINTPAGTYQFTAIMDDGMRVWVDDQLVIDSWYDSQVHTVQANVYLTGGNHDVQVEYYQASGGAIARLDWTLVSSTIINWRGEYFTNTFLSGTPTVVRDDPQINFVWSGSPAPDVSADNFSVRWTRSLQLDPGRYRFTVLVDDGVRLWVNNQLLIDQWIDQTVAAYSAEIDLPGGPIPIQMDYYEHGGGAIAQLSWTKIATIPGGPAVPQDAWLGEYFNSVTPTGFPALVRNDAAIDFDWGLGSPAPGSLSPDRFSVRWTGSINLANAGNYTFTAMADDGVRVWVNGQLLIDRWTLQPAQSFTGSIDLPAGNIPVVIEYFENTDLAEVHLTWSATGTAPGTGDPPTATVVDARYLNVRSGPGLEFEPFTYLNGGERVELLAKDLFMAWIKVRSFNGVVGWVSARYLSSSYSFANLPTATE